MQKWDWRWNGQETTDIPMAWLFSLSRIQAHFFSMQSPHQWLSLLAELQNLTPDLHSQPLWFNSSESNANVEPELGLTNGSERSPASLLDFIPQHVSLVNLAPTACHPDLGFCSLITPFLLRITCCYCTWTTISEALITTNIYWVLTMSS